MNGSIQGTDRRGRFRIMTLTTGVEYLVPRANITGTELKKMSTYDVVTFDLGGNGQPTNIEFGKKYSKGRVIG